MIYYVDNINGASSNDGLTPQTAVASYKDLTIAAGDKILFRSGCVFYEHLKCVDGTQENPTVYGAYGTGEKPIFSFAYYLDDESLWQECEQNIWKYTGVLPSEPGNIYFDGGWGMLRWDYAELKDQGDWYYTHIGFTIKPETCPEEEKNTPKILYMYSAENPAKVYKNLKGALINDWFISYAESHVVIENLAFEYSGALAFESYRANNVTIRGCDYRYIGGAVWHRYLKIRYGNAIEFWTYCRDILIENCTFDEVYDSCTTHQGSGEYKTPENIKIINNRFKNYGMAAYELRDKISYNTYFCNNVCENAGVGMCVDYVEGPRHSEIYPQPMGHHLFIWRIDEPTPGGFVEISGNTFGSAPCGSAIYSIINEQAEAQLIIKDNVFSNDCDTLIKMGGKYYSEKTFNER